MTRGDFKSFTAIHVAHKATALMSAQRKSQCQIATEKRDAACIRYRNSPACVAAERSARQKCHDPRPRPPLPPRPYPPRPWPPQPYPPRPRPPAPATCSGPYRSTVFVFNATPCPSSIALLARTSWGGFQTLGLTPTLSPYRYYRYVLCGLLPPYLTVQFQQLPQGRECRSSLVTATLPASDAPRLPLGSSSVVSSDDGLLVAMVTPAVQGGEATVVVTAANRSVNDESISLPAGVPVMRANASVASTSLADVSGVDSEEVYLDGEADSATPAGGGIAARHFQMLKGMPRSVQRSASYFAHGSHGTMCSVGTAML